jgi:hypothetical protein
MMMTARTVAVMMSECTVLERRDVRFDLNITSRLTVGTRGSSSRSAIKYPSSSGQPEYCELF